MDLQRRVLLINQRQVILLNIHQPSRQIPKLQTAKATAMSRNLNQIQMNLTATTVAVIKIRSPSPRPSHLIRRPQLKIY